MDKVFSVLGHLSSWLARPRLGDAKPPTLWPSSAGAVDKNGKLHGSCRRATFLQYLVPLVSYSEKADKRYVFWNDLVKIVKEAYIPPNKYTLWLFDAGERYEEHIVELAKEAGLWIGSQVQVYLPKWNLSGKIDLITLNPETGKFSIDEVKSVYSYSADHVLGKNFERFNNFTGEPRTKNLMQLAIYQYHYADDKFENGRLQYGDRGTGKYAEYEVKVDKVTGVINYRCIDPVVQGWKEVPYTVLDILDFYQGILNAVDQGVLPPKDFSIKYTLDELETMINEQYTIIEIDKEDNDVAKYDSIDAFINAANGIKSRKFYVEDKVAAQLAKDTAEQHIKHRDRKVNGGRQVKPADDGSFVCRYCNYKDFCWNQDGSPKN